MACNVRRAELGSCGIDDSNCEDDDNCTSDNCEDNSCQYREIDGCCASDSDCNDSLMCTVDACGESTNRCEYAKIDDCCETDTDCDENLDCTTDVCESYIRKHAAVVNRCEPGDGCPDLSDDELNEAGDKADDTKEPAHDLERDSGADVRDDAEADVGEDADINDPREEDDTKGCQCSIENSSRSDSTRLLFLLLILTVLLSARCKRRNK